MTDRRPVRVNESIFRRLDELLPQDRTAAGAVEILSIELEH